MGNYEAKTKPHAGSVEEFVARAEPEIRRAESAQLIAILRRVTGEDPVMWGPSIIGFGKYSYRYDSGHSGAAPRIGFSPRKAKLVVYVMPGLERYKAELARLGAHSTGKSCLYTTRLAAWDADVLEALLTRAFADMAVLYPEG